MISKGFNLIDFGIIVSSILSQDKSIFNESNSKNFSREFFYKLFVNIVIILIMMLLVIIELLKIGLNNLDLNLKRFI